MKKLTEVAVILSAVDQMSKVIKTAVGKGEQALTSFAKRSSALGSKALNWGKQAMVTGALILAPLFMSINAAEESAVAMNRLTAVYRSMGETSGLVAKQQADFASSLQFEIGIEDEQIMLVQAKLATFSNVMSKEARDAGVMARATELAFDMQAAGFGQGEMNAVQLGKALQDPIKGIKALAKSGVTFTDAEQKKIAALVKSGRLLEAQEIVLKAIEGQVGGVAKSTVTDSAKMKLAWGELQEQVGGALLPEMVKLSKFVTKDLLPGFLKWKSENEGLFSGLVKVVAVVGILAATFGTFGMIFGGVMKGISAASTILKSFTYITRIATAAQWLMNAAAYANPYVLIAIAIIAVIAAIVAVMVYFDQLYNWFMKQSLAIKILIGLLVYLVAPFLVFPIVIRLVIKHWDYLMDKFNQFLGWFRGWGKFIMLPLAPFLAIPLLIIAYWGRIKTFFVGLWNFVKNVFLFHVAIIMAIPRLIRDRWFAMINFYRNLWETIKGVFTGFVSFVMSIPGRMYEAGINIINSLYEGMKSVVNKPVEVIRNVTDQVRDYLPFSPAKRGALRDIHRIKLMETIAGSIKPSPVLSAMDKITGMIAGKSGNPIAQAIPSLIPATAPKPNSVTNNSSAGTMFSITNAPTYNITGSGEGGAISKDDLLKVLQMSKDDLLKIFQQALANNERKKL